MKLYAILLGFLFIFLGKISCSQEKILETKVDANFNDSPLLEVVANISKTTKIYFSFNPEIIPNNIKITFKRKRILLSELLNKIFAETNIQYKVVDKQIVLYDNNSGSNKLSPHITDSVPYYQICGKIIDLETRKPLNYASVSILGTSLGTISNSTGEFLFKFTNTTLSQKLVIHYLGYKPYYLEMDKLSDEFHFIELEPITVQLKEIKVVYKDVMEILRKTVSKIPKNYDSIPCRLTGFIRESTQQNENYISISEAVVEINKVAYSDYFRTDQARIFKGRTRSNFRKMEALRYRVQGGIFNSLQLDIVRYLPSFLSTEYFEFYKYEMCGIVTIQNRQVYLIKFDQIDNLNTSLYKGSLYIDVENYSLISAEFELSPKGIEFAGAMLVRSSPIRIKVKPQHASYCVNYKLLNNRWFLSDIHAEIQIKTKAKKHLFNSLYTTKMEMVITERDSLHYKRFKMNETAKISDVLQEQVGEYDEAFWGKFNTIKPDEPIIEAINKIAIRKALVE